MHLCLFQVYARAFEPSILPKFFITRPPINAVSWTQLRATSWHRCRIPSYIWGLLGPSTQLNVPLFHVCLLSSAKSSRDNINWASGDDKDHSAVRSRELFEPAYTNKSCRSIFQQESLKIVYFEENLNYTAAGSLINEFFGKSLRESSIAFMVDNLGKT